ncbi:M20 metallopeptidase family protein [Peribacillus sp. TH16]|uniref:M20 metallopeptidase family protein n=1 Tax=Peribacillus sp. TH16 TaxID=2798482 RepID=UPI001A91F62A|nr:amidohydrolase [Peribacillus sp. TH16]
MESENKGILEKALLDLESGFTDIVNWRRHLHQYPELSFQETETSHFIAEKLISFGLEVRKNVGGNGVIGILSGENPGKTIALRADFDALPIQDEKETPYKSLKSGVMHACGHDGHTAALLGTARTLSKFREKLKGRIIFVFQHAEEKPPGGAKDMLGDGALEGVDAVYGAHLATDIPVGKIAVGSGYKMAAVDAFEITIEGKGGHGARPQEAIDSIVIGSEIVQALQKIVSRRISPLQSAVVTIGVFHAGSAFNIIANTAKLEGTVRTFNQEVRFQIEEEIRSIVKGITEANHAAYKIDYLNGYPALYNHRKETKMVRNIFVNTFSEEAVVEFSPSMGAEDFSYFLLEKPGTYFKIGARNEDDNTHFPHHHPRFDFDEIALIDTGKAFIAIVSKDMF